MPILISMLRGINVGPHNRIKMDTLRSLYKSTKFDDPRTYVQSGNIIFRTKDCPTPELAKKIQAAIERECKCSPDVILRTAEELRRTVAANPFAKRKEVEPGKLLVTFLSGEPGAAVQATLDELGKKYPEELHLRGRELFIYFPNGAGNSKLPWSQVEKLTKLTGTARNWNSVMNMLKIAEEMEAG